jgi:tetratricopeptide (TPR) repeat protein
MTVRVARYSLAALSVLAFCYSLVIARSIVFVRQNTPQSLARAIQLVPYSDRYQVLLASWNPNRSDAALKRALRLNPFDSDSWIQLGLQAEFRRKDPALAERYYKRAVEVDHMSLPRWTLANFYFRRQNRQQFFVWARKTLEITPYDGGPVFASLWTIDSDPGHIEQAIPDKIRTLIQYSLFLTQTGRLDLVTPILEKAIAQAPAGLPSKSLVGYKPIPLGAILDQLLKGARVRPAIELWSRLITAHWIPARTVPSVSHPLTNPDFRQPFFEHGFDWMTPPVHGISLDSYSEPQQIAFGFSGSQPERCIFLQQFIPLRPGQRYLLTWVADLDQVARDNGLTWQINAIQNGAPRPTGLRSPDLTSASGSPAVWDFQAPDASDLFLLSLQYARPLGKVRIEGSLTLRSIALHLVQ